MQGAEKIDCLGQVRTDRVFGAARPTGQLDQLAQNLLHRFGQQLEQQVEAATAAGAQLQEQPRKQTTDSPGGSPQALAQPAAEEFCSRLEQMLEGFLVRSAREIEAQHEASLRKHREAFEKQIEDLLKDRRPEPGRVVLQMPPAPKAPGKGLWTGMKIGLGLAGVALLSVVVYSWTRPVVRLRANPPASFLEERPEWNEKRRAQEKQLARTYWELAVQAVQQKYEFGMRLPEQPPVEFQIEGKDQHGAGFPFDPVTRDRYWNKLRQIWAMPDAWEESSRLDADWICRASEWLHLRAEACFAR